MPDHEALLFLHHYEASPYAEKIRAMLGSASSPWASVLSPPYPPRPNLQPLVGDFRRIPVAHIGADVFCDTSLIAREVAALTGRPEFAPENADADAAALAQRAEAEVFFCAITAAPALSLLGKLVISNGLRGTFRFVKDRTAMMKDASMRPPQGRAAARVLEGFLRDLDERLSDREVLDDKNRSYADFCAYHPVWLALSVGSLKTLRAYPGVQRWYEGIVGLGHGGRREAGAEEALATVRSADPRPLEDGGEAHELLNTEVLVAPSDYGKAGVAGTLVTAAADRYVLARSTEHCGTIHLHLPREGYSLRPRGA
ncbi:MAG: glutathione S-transferase N-terminal domain-containing protein [Halieaceae bacterium]|nr:glutathione S-transferase N-terminal domain-containing protein [Halieaceae bacterium]